MKLCLEVVILLTFCLNSVISIIMHKGFTPAGEDVIDFDKNEDIFKHERYARHVQAITESVVEHIVKELRTRFPEVKKRMSRDKLNHIAEELNAMIQILKRKRIKTRKSKSANGTKRSSIFWKNKLMLNK